MENLTNLTFCTGLKTDAEFHAGNNFFAIVYRDYVTFLEDKVILTKKVVLPFRPMDDSDIQWFNEYEIEGSYTIQDNYIECWFEKLSWRFKGFVEKTPDKILILSNFDERLKKSWSEVYMECI